MDKRTFVGLCAALAFVAASPGAYALKIFENQQATAMAVVDAEMAGSFTYAAETLLMGTDNVTEASDDSDTAAYYNIGGDDVHLAAPVGIAATEGDTYVVTFTLDGMVFQDGVAAGDLDPGTWSLATGGASGDKLAVFRLTDGTIETTAALNLEANFAISGSAGTATMTITNQTLAGLGIPGVSGREEHKGTVIKVAAALDEDAMAMNATADVAASFKKFVDGMSIASVGSLLVGFEAHRSASTGDAIVAITEIIVTADDGDGDPQSTVTFMGDFSFANKVYTHGDADCGVAIGDTGDSGTPDTDLAATETDLLMRDDDMEVSDTTMTKAVNVADADDPLTTRRHLCIMVQGEDDESEDGMDAPRIPETGAYTAMGSYTGIDDAAIGPKPQAQTLGMIGRNGTTVRLPYLTTNAKFNQRLYIVNRGSEAGYEMDFQEGDTAGALAIGTLDPDSRTIISVGGTATQDPLVTIGEGGSTSGSLIIEAGPGMIDVVTVQVSRELGTTDTVVYAAD